jgi:hypothetical protein
MYVQSDFTTAVPLKVEALCRLGKEPVSVKAFVHGLADVCLRLAKRPGVPLVLSKHERDFCGTLSLMPSGDVVWHPPPPPFLLPRLEGDLRVVFATASDSGVTIEARTSGPPHRSPAPPALPAVICDIGAPPLALTAAAPRGADLNRHRGKSATPGRTLEMAVTHLFNTATDVRISPFSLALAAALPFVSHLELHLLPGFQQVKEAADALGAQLAHVAPAL